MYFPEKNEILKIKKQINVKIQGRQNTRAGKVNSNREADL